MSAPTSGPSSLGIRPLGSLVRFAWGNLVALLLEATLGVGLNLYVSLLSSPTYVQVFASVPLLTAHIALGFLLVVATGVFVVLSRRAGVPGLTWRAALVLLFVLVALQEGFSYTFTGTPAFSSGMALAFLLAAIFEGLVVVHLRRAARSPVPAPTGPTST